MQITKNYVLGLTLAISLMACGKEEKTKTVTVENQKTVEELKKAQEEVKKGQEEVNKLKEQLKLAGDVDTVKAELEAAKAALEKADVEAKKLEASIKVKDAAIETAKKDLAAAIAAGDKKAKELEKNVAKLEGEKKTLQDLLKAAEADKVRLEGEIKKTEEMFKNILDYAVKHKATDRASIGVALDTDLKAIDARLLELAGQKDGLSSAIEIQTAVVVAARDALTKAEQGIKEKYKYEDLAKRAEAGEVLSAEDAANYATLKAYFDAATGEADAKKAKDDIETAITGLDKEIIALKATLAKAEADLAKYNQELLALVLVDTKLESPRIQELLKLIADAKELTAKSNETKTAKEAALGEQRDLLAIKEAEIKAFVEIKKKQEKIYGDSVEQNELDKLLVAEKELENRRAAYFNLQKDTTDAQAEKEYLTALKTFYDDKLKPAAAK